MAVRLLRASAAAAAGVTSADSMGSALPVGEAVSGSAVSDATIGVSGTGAVRERAGAAWAAVSFTSWPRAAAQSEPAGLELRADAGVLPLQVEGRRSHA